jgi:hypothetical protein
MTLEEYEQELEAAAEKISDDMTKAVTELCLVIAKREAFENEPALLDAAKTIALKRIETFMNIVEAKTADAANGLDL